MSLYSLVLQSPHPYADGRVECKGDLNASRALLFLERTILFKRIRCHPVAWPPVEVWVECKKSLSEAVALLVLDHTILLKRTGSPPWSLEAWPQDVSDAGALRNKER